MSDNFKHEDLVKKMLKDLIATTMAGKYEDSLPDMIIEQLYEEWSQKKSQEIIEKLNLKLKKEHAIQVRRERIKQIRNYLYIGMLLALLIGLLVNQITYVITQYVNVWIAIIILIIIIVIVFIVIYFEFEDRKLDNSNKESNKDSV